MSDLKKILTSIAILALIGLASQPLQAGVIKHPVYDPGLTKADAESLEKSVQKIMSFTEQEILDLVPIQSAIEFCGCPNCTASNEELYELISTKHISSAVQS